MNCLLCYVKGWFHSLGATPGSSWSATICRSFMMAFNTLKSTQMGWYLAGSNTKLVQVMACTKIGNMKQWLPWLLRPYETQICSNDSFHLNTQYLYDDHISNVYDVEIISSSFPYLGLILLDKTWNKWQSGELAAHTPSVAIVMDSECCLSSQLTNSLLLWLWYG